MQTFLTLGDFNETPRPQRVRSNKLISTLIFVLFFSKDANHERNQALALQVTSTTCKNMNERSNSHELSSLSPFSMQLRTKFNKDVIDIQQRKRTFILSMSPSKVNEDDDMLPSWTSSFDEDVDRYTKNEIEIDDSSGSSGMEETTMSRIEEQQRQIDLLMKMVQQQNKNVDDNSSSKKSESRTLNSDNIKSNEISTINTDSPKNNVGAVAPLKAMMFIDGTWLYYSIHERRGDKCPITPAYGRGWQQHYAVDW